MNAGLPRVVIIGGGFAGLYAARELSGAPVRVTLCDRRNYHLFQPLLYQVATASLSPGQIAQPIRHILKDCPNVEVLMAEARAVEPEAKRVVLDEGSLDYDYLIVAAGNGTSYFGHDDWKEAAPGLKDLEDALEVRRRVLGAFEAAERSKDETLRREQLAFVIVGGGPTGVELAGALAEIAQDALPRDFRSIKPQEARIILLEGGPRLLAAFPKELGEQARLTLEAKGVEVRLGAQVSRLAEGEVEAGPWKVRAKTLLWAAGVSASPLAQSLGAPLDRGGRVFVEPDLSVPGRPELYVAGDLAAPVDPDGKPLPAMAPLAIQTGRHAARNILRSLRGEKTLPFKFHDKGMMAVIGRNQAVASIAGRSLRGFIGWAVWLVVHICFLIGFRNRAAVLFDWAWSYFTYQRGVRLITEKRR